MIHTKERAFTREEAVKLVKHMIRKDTMDYVIRDTLLDKGLSVYEALSIIREVRKAEADNPEPYISQYAMEMGLTIITVIMLIIILFLLISPVY